MQSTHSAVVYFLTTLALFALVLTFIGGPNYYDPRSYQYAWNFGHVIAFYLWTYLCLLHFYKLRACSFPRQLILFTIIAFVLGVIIELLQSLIGRDPNWYDVINDVLGSVLAISLLSTQRRQINQMIRLMLVACILFAIAINNRGLLMVLVDDYAARQQFPVLSNFSEPFEISRWQGAETIQIIKGDDLSASNLLKIDLGTDRYSGVILQHFPSDWSTYSYLLIDYYNPANKVVELTCRIHDKAHEMGEQYYDDRFNRKILLRPGWNKLKINLEDVINAPAQRQMDISDIMAIGLFATQLKYPQTVYIGSVQLARE